MFFKGRDSHIQEIVSLLQENKFLMVTGASGDGKSSIIFSGLVPNARAGFFKAKYNGWEIASCRPERTPVKNLSAALAPIFGVEETTVHTELRRGFGSLVDLYKGSRLYQDTTTNTWINATEEERKEQSRSNANLLIIIDQFEEFFTNPENYRNGAPTEEAQTLVNLLLETSRLALEQDLPIYVVFTMRSDYIGQCAAFRGLPEFIGFSQFFVPRLKRKELKQVIEQPAILNGNSIAPRLVERILYDLSEGVDQLPVLQHTLSQIWLIADHGKQEMDLIHYAKVGGMAADQLPDEDKEVFNTWYNSLEDWRKEHLKHPSLQEVLDIHADALYEGAWEYYQTNTGKQDISRQDAKLIIAITFACLTKIDHSRAVRNRMSLQEITDIINKPELTTEVVGKVINIYREQGNTFIRPFIDENDPDTQELKPDTVLDITHESLIRNWQRLTGWANKEYEYYETYLDFAKQLQKWLDSGQDKGYLLPIGPLTFFEDWEADCRPNKYWINRYNSIYEDRQANLEASAEILDNGHDFLRKSTRKVFVSKAFMKYGSLKIATALAVVLVTVLSGFFYFDALRKQNSRVLRDVHEKAGKLLLDPQINPFEKGIYTLAAEQVYAGSMLDGLRMINDEEERINVAIGAYNAALFVDRNFMAAEKNDLVNELSALFSNSELSAERDLQLRNLFIDLLGYDYYFNNQALIGATLQEQTARIPGLILEIIETNSYDDILIINRGIENYLNWNNDPLDEINNLLEAISPFTQSSKPNFDKLYPLGTGIRNGRAGNISHNGGYQIIAYLYAATGDLARVSQATDSLFKYNSNYMDVLTFNNATNIIGYLVQFDHQDQVSEYLKHTAYKSGMSTHRLMLTTLDHSTGINSFYSLFRFSETNFNPGLSVMLRIDVEVLFDLAEETIKDIPDLNTRLFQLALLYKQRGAYLSASDYLPSQNVTKEEIYPWFDKAFEQFGLVSEAYLDESETINYRYYNDGVRRRDFKRSYFFFYPDYFYDQWHSDKFVSTSFMEYLLDKGIFNSFYRDTEKLETINDWLANYYEFHPFANETRGLAPFGSDVLAKIFAAITANPAAKDFDPTFFQLLLTNNALDNGEINEATNIYKEVDLKKISTLANRWQYLNYTFIYNEALTLAKKFAQNGLNEEALAIIEIAPNRLYKSTMYSEVARYLYAHDLEPLAFRYLDSAIVNDNKLSTEDVESTILNSRLYLIGTMAGIGGETLNKLALESFVELGSFSKNTGEQFYIQGIAAEGNYYRAVQAIPEESSPNAQLQHFTNIMFEESNHIPKRPGWQELNETRIAIFLDYIFFRDQN